MARSICGLGRLYLAITVAAEKPYICVTCAPSSGAFALSSDSGLQGTREPPDRSHAGPAKGALRPAKRAEASFSPADSKAESRG